MLFIGNQSQNTIPTYLDQKSLTRLELSIYSDPLINKYLTNTYNPPLIACLLAAVSRKMLEEMNLGKERKVEN